MRNRIRIKVIYSLLFVLLCLSLSAQEKPTREKVVRKATASENYSRFDISTNVFDWADYGTINLDASMSLSRHLSLQLGAKYNPWAFRNEHGPTFLTQNQQKSVSLGIRIWPWYVYSGWYICIKGQYCDFSECGVWRQALDEGVAVGGGLSAGYAIMLGKHVNLELGAGGWGGRLLKHNLYRCPDDAACLETPRESGPKNFIAINDLNISFHWLF